MPALLRSEDLVKELKKRAEGYGNAEALARELSVHRTTLYKILVGTRELSDEMARKMGYVKIWVKNGAAYRKPRKTVYVK